MNPLSPLAEPLAAPEAPFEVILSNMQILYDKEDNELANELRDYLLGLAASVLHIGLEDFLTKEEIISQLGLVKSGFQAEDGRMNLGLKIFNMHRQLKSDQPFTPEVLSKLSNGNVAMTSMNPNSINEAQLYGEDEKSTVILIQIDTAALKIARIGADLAAKFDTSANATAPGIKKPQTDAKKRVLKLLPDGAPVNGPDVVMRPTASQLLSALADFDPKKTVEK